MAGQPLTMNSIGLATDVSDHEGLTLWPRKAPVDCVQIICSLLTFPVLISLSSLWRVS